MNSVSELWNVKCLYPEDHAGSGDTDSALDLVFDESLGTVWLLRFVNVSTAFSISAVAIESTWLGCT